MQSNVDWLSIRAEFEQGLSQRSLALKYGIEQSTISRRATKEKWSITPRITPASESISDASDIPALLEAALRNLAKLNPENFLSLNEHKLFADALNQYNKIRITLPQEDQEHSAYDLRVIMRYCTPEQIAVIKPILAEAEAKKAMEEKKITPIKKFG